MNSHKLPLPVAVLLLVIGGSWAQGPAKPQPVARQSPSLTAPEQSMLQNTVVADARTRQILGPGAARVMLGDAQPDKYQEITYLKGETQTPPEHHVWAILFNPATNKAARAFMSLEQNTVLTVQEIKPADVPLSRVDEDEAFALAKASPDVRRAIGSRIDQFVVFDRGTPRPPLAVQALRFRSVDSNDPCTLDRCLDLLFRTETGFLPLRVAVDLTQHTVTVRNSPGKGKHP